MNYLDASCICEALCNAFGSSQTIKKSPINRTKSSSAVSIRRLTNERNTSHQNDRVDFSRQPDFTYPSFEGINGCLPIKGIASGGYGKVYLVKMINMHPNQETALKVFDAFDAKNNLFECEREKAILQHIAVHETEIGKKYQIAHVRDDIKGVRCPNLMLQYVNGFDLTENLLNKRAFSSLDSLIAFIKSLMEQIGVGVLGSLHSMNIYHNDLKPANIMFDPHKQLFYLIDFGLAVPLSLLKHAEFIRSNFFTTLQYMSPWHLKLILQSRYILDGRVRYDILSNNNQTRSYAANADFYSFALAVIRILGRHCHGNDSLCGMAKRIVSFQKDYFIDTDERGFAKWDIEALEKKFNPYWRRISYSEL